MHRALANRSLTLLHLTLSEFVVERKARALTPADIYHKLKRPERFAFLRDRPQLLSRRPTSAAPPRCEALRVRYQRVARLSHCCAEWTFCDFFGRETPGRAAARLARRARHHAPGQTRRAGRSDGYDGNGKVAAEPLK